MQVSTAAASDTTAQDRPTAARSPRRVALGTRLIVYGTLAVALVITLITFVGTLVAQRQLDNDLHETAEVTAFAVADDIELRQEPIATDTLVPVLRSFMNAAPDLRSITVFRAVDGRPEMLVSTSVVAPVAPALVEDVITRGDMVTSQPAPDTLVVAVPIGQPGTITGAVAVAVSVRTVRQLQRAAAVVAFGGDAFAVLAIAALMALLARLRDRNQELVRSYQSASRLRETAARAQQLAAVGQTMANVAHQIGTPLNLVSGHVQLLEHEISDPNILRRLHIVDEQIDRVVATVRSLLERARPQRERQDVRIDSVLARMGDAMRARLASSGVTLNLKVQQPLASIAADEAQLELALLNLVSNALDAMPHGGTLTLAARNVDGRVRIDVRDTGTGIDPDVLPRLFEPWVTTKPAGRGTGLGLSITRDLITSLGGIIALSTSSGHGTTFTIELPAAGSETDAS
jgi:signal transduction histidine kinase